VRISIVCVALRSRPTLIVNTQRPAISAYRRLDVLINYAGVLLVGAETDKIPLDTFDEHLRCNVRTAFLMTKQALPHLRETQGNVICAGSASGVNGESGATAYGGTKGFLHAFMAGVAVEQAKYGVRANCAMAGREASTPPAPTIALQHSQDGTRHKDILRLL
jgi:NAD(P)-dependent dehydrogenase (short-subunit alcohol dehydrogenase family)